jgi:ribosomal protein L7Ae-like RNA K-turn-binding protein
MIGLARRAGKAVIGSGCAENAVRGGKAKLVILAEDAAEGTVKRLTDKCKTYDVLLIIKGSKQSIGQITGRQQTAAVAVTDINFANELKRLCEDTGVY